MIERTEYDAPPLHRSDLLEDPIEQLRQWIKEAGSYGLREPAAMLLSTASATGLVTARTVICKQLLPEGLVFFTNYQSAKAQQIAENSQVAASFVWLPIYRQVLIQGVVEQASEELSDRYFATRPRGSQIAAWVSQPQSGVIPSRSLLQEAFRVQEARFEGKEVERPPFWGGYLIRPKQIEFWQGQRNRMHDRLRYLRGAGGWRLERLAP